MKTYKIEASYVTYVYMFVDAETIDEAKDIAYIADGGDFKETDLCDWNIDSVKEVTQ